MAKRTFYEFFAGGGMARAGLGDGWQCLFANDIDATKAASYRANWGEAEMRVADVGLVKPRDLPGRADLAWASFPCQDLSLAGAGAGLGGERSGAFMPFWMLMLKLRGEGRAPRLIVLENVCGLLTSHGGRDFAELCRMLWKADYRFGALVMDAADFVPQSRPRLFIVAVAHDLDATGPVDGPDPRWHPANLLKAHSALREDLQKAWLWFAPPKPQTRNTRLIDLIENEPEGVDWHTEAQTDRLLGMMTPLNRAKVTSVVKKGGRAVGGVYRRTRPDGENRQQRAEVRFDGLAGCLRTPGGGSSRQTILVVEDGRVRSRLLSARETARLMGLDDSYVLPERYNDAYHLTGDGVAVPVVRWLAETVLEPSFKRLALAA